MLKFFGTFFLIINYANAWDIATPGQQVKPEVVKDISFMYYTGPGPSDYTKIPLENGNDILKQPSFNSSRKIVFFLHGWSETPSNPGEWCSTPILAEAFLTSNVATFIGVNYENLVQYYYNITSWTPQIVNMGAGYVQAVQNTTYIGAALGQFLKSFIPACNCEDNIHLIGFSLGAQIISYIAANYGSGKLKRLTALEAAGPIYTLPGYEHLDLYQGIFIDAIHTDSGVFGYRDSYGTVDFRPNFGTAIQSHCIGNSVYKCNHYMAVRYYAESVKNVYSFKAVLCSNAMMWSSFLCTNNVITHMGYGVSINTPRGDYYLRTNKDPPYSIDDKGIFAVAQK